MEHAMRGAAALEASDALAAATCYTKALLEHPTSPDYFTQRSTALTRLKPARHDLALRDAQFAILLGRKRQSREKIQAGQQRRVVSLYGLGRYDEAKQILDSMLKWRQKDNKKEKMEHDMWMARITSKLKSRNTESQAVPVITEYPEIELPNEKSLKAWLKGQLRSDGTLRLDGEDDADAGTEQTSERAAALAMHVGEVNDKDGAEVRTSQSKITPPTNPTGIVTPQSEITPPTNPTGKVKVQPIRNDWYQDSNAVTISLYAKKVDKTKLQSDVTSDRIELMFPHPGAPDETFSFVLDPTFASVDPNSSVVKVLGTKIELRLVKQEKGVKWPALDDKNRPKTDRLPNAWTTKDNQDWDKKAAAIVESQSKKRANGKMGDEESDNDADSDFGGDPTDAFFRKLYAGSDEDTRRAMMKSFHESNGTVLSTNWSEVSQGKVEQRVKDKDGGSNNDR